MRTVTRIYYDQEDFDKVEQEMTVDRAIEILERLPRGYFPYNMPMWSASCDSSDFAHYEICVALNMAVKALKSVKQ